MLTLVGPDFSREKDELYFLVNCKITLNCTILLKGVKRS